MLCPAKICTTRGLRGIIVANHARSRLPDANDKRWFVRTLRAKRKKRPKRRRNADSSLHLVEKVFGRHAKEKRWRWWNGGDETNGKVPVFSCSEKKNLLRREKPFGEKNPGACLPVRKEEEFQGWENRFDWKIPARTQYNHIIHILRDLGNSSRDRVLRLTGP